MRLDHASPRRGQHRAARTITTTQTGRKPGTPRLRQGTVGLEVGRLGQGTQGRRHPPEGATAAPPSTSGCARPHRTGPADRSRPPESPLPALSTDRTGSSTRSSGWATAANVEGQGAVRRHEAVTVGAGDGRVRDLVPPRAPGGSRPRSPPAHEVVCNTARRAEPSRTASAGRSGLPRPPARARLGAPPAGRGRALSRSAPDLALPRPCSPGPRSACASGFGLAAHRQPAAADVPVEGQAAERVSGVRRWFRSAPDAGRPRLAR